VVWASKYLQRPRIKSSLAYRKNQSRFTQKSHMLMQLQRQALRKKFRCRSQKVSMRIAKSFDAHKMKCQKFLALV
jgi:hypothetical protein